MKYDWIINKSPQEEGTYFVLCRLPAYFPHGNLARGVAYWSANTRKWHNIKSNAMAIEVVAWMEEGAERNACPELHHGIYIES